MYNFFGKYFKLTLLFLILIKLLSFNAYLYPFLNPIFFFIIIILTLILSLIKFEYGIYILLAELFVGSKGYLLSMPFGNLDFSLRIGLFLIVMSIWLAKVIFQLKQKKSLKEAISFLNSRFFILYSVFFVFLILGLTLGFIRNNSFENIFFDFNGWLYFLLILPIFEVIKGKEQVENIFQVLFASLFILSLETIFLFYIFSHQIELFIPSIYYWIRKSGVGEITMVNLSFYRVFIQSQIYILIGFFVLLPIFIKKITQKEKDYFRFFDLLLLCGLALLISFSRSFWIGLILGLIFLLFVCKFYFHESWKKFFKISYYLTAIFLVDIFLIIFLINFPQRGMVDFASLIQQRIFESSQEAAGRSRIDLLPPLFQLINKHPIIGSGFGTTVTYKSSDPRVLEISIGGWYTTYAFEWGYLDIWLKIGLAGLLVYLYLIWRIFKQGWKQTNRPLILGMLIGLLALAVTSIFSPYLNHPLGIGYIMLCTIVFEKLLNQQFDNQNNLTMEQ